MFKALAFTLVSSALLLTGCQLADPVSLSQPVTQAVTSPKLKLRSDVVTGQLNNGLKYVLLNNKIPEEKVSLQLVVHAGSLVEADDQKGIAHLVEHMAFNGTKLYPGNRIIDRQQELGMTFGRDVNAMTGYHATSYFLHLPDNKPEMVDEGLTMLSQQVSALTFVHEELVKERPVVEEEWRRKLGLRSRIGRAGREALMAGSRFVEREPIGDMELVRHLHASRIEAFWNDWYHPNNMTMIIVGDIDEADARQLLEKHFSQLEAKPLPERPDLSIPLNHQPELILITDDELSNTSISINLRTQQPVIETRADLRRSLVESIATGLFNKRMAEQYQIPSEQFSRIMAAGQPFGVDYVSTRFSGTLVNDDLEAGIHELFAEISRYAHHGFTETDLKFIKTALNKKYRVALKRTNKKDNRRLLSEIASKVSRQQALIDNKAYLKTAITLLNEISLSQVNRTFKQKVTSLQPLVIVQGNTRLAANKIEQSQLESWWKVSLAHPPAVIEELKATGQLLKHKPQPAAIVAYQQIADIHHWKLANGVDVWFQTSDKVKGSLRIRWQGKGGSLHLPKDLQRASQLATTHMQNFGYGGFTALELGNLNNTHQVNLRANISSLDHGISGSVSTDDYEAWLQNLYLQITQPQVDDKIWLAKQANIANRVEKQKITPAQALQRQIQKVQTLDEPLSRPLSADEVRNISSAKLLAAWQSLFANSRHSQLVVFGDAEPEQIIEQARYYVGSLTVSEQVPEVNLPELATGEHKVKIKEGNQPTAETVVLLNAPYPYSQQTRVHAQLLSRIISQKLRLKLREEAAGVYTTSFRVSLDKHRQQAFASLSYSHQPQRAYELKAMALNIFKSVALKGVTQQELEHARNLSLKSFDPTSIKPRVKFSWLASMAEEGKYQDKAQQVITTLNKTEVADINQLAAAILTTNNRIEGLLLPEKL